MTTSGAPVVVPPVPPVAEDEISDHCQAQALPTVHAFPWRHTKTIHFVRHGEGYHNGALTDKVLDSRQGCFLASMQTEGVSVLAACFYEDNFSDYNSHRPEDRVL